ncbi:MAG: SusC/RagA family TonB-linked outer membrane protein [Mucilaginibacter sp.]|nr:SusC/RagA family TonB-linked outer membrane protein [Mucilaginibacter sp.]
MKLTTILMIVGFLQVSAVSHAQHINLSAKNISLGKLFRQIEKQSGYAILYDADILKDLPNVNVEINNATIEEVMAKCFQGKPLDYKIVDKNIVVRRMQEAPTLPQKAIAGVFTGAVFDQHQQPLPGVTIKIKGALTGQTVSNEKGMFSILILDVEHTVLQLSYVGYLTQEVPVAHLRSPFAVMMQEDIGKLDEVQVIAYGHTTRRLNTGDQTNVTAKDIQNYPVGNVLSVLQGTVPGMVISQTTGQAGSTYKVVIRGQNGINTSSDPLYIIDGIPYSGGGYSSQKSNYLGSNNQAYDALSFINPLDIESINVLKDADATAIYGSRGANGVILITTKKGKAGDTKVDVNVYSGISEAVTVPQFLNTQQYLQMRREGRKNDNQTTFGPTEYDLNGTWDTTRYTNWPKLFLGAKGNMTNVQASISGGSNNTSYLVSGNFRNVTNVQPLIGKGDQTASLHFNLNSSSNNGKFNITLTGGYTSDINTIPSADLSSFANQAPDAPALYTPDGTLNFQNNTFINPLLKGNLLANTTVSNITSSMVLSYVLAKGLRLQATLGYNKQSLNEFLGVTLASYQPSSLALGTKGSSNFSYDNKSFWSLEPQLNYNTQLSKGTLEITGGASLQKQLYDAMQLQASGYTTDLLINNIAGGTGITAVGQGYNAYTYKYSAIFGRANYNWENKYILNVSGRYDGSSKFGQDRQFHLFYATGAAWLFSSEDFVKKALPFLSFGKLRASYGITGNDQIPPYLYLENFSLVTAVNAYQGIPGLLATNLPNPYLSWETTKKLNFGLELQFFNGRIGLEGNYFINRTDNTLASAPLSSTTGFTTINENIAAKVQNKGIDISLNTTNIQGRDFNWSSSFTFSRQRNALLSYPNATPAIAQLLNNSVNAIYTNRYAGVNPQTGLYQFYDRNGNIVATPASNGSDQVHMINTNPDYFGTMSNTFSYKGFSLNVLFRGIKQIGQSSFGQILTSGSLVPGIQGTNYPIAILDRWQKPGDVATFGRYSSTLGATFTNAQTINRAVDAYYGDASYIRLQNASLGYQFSKQISSKLHLKSLRIYALGENLATISGYKFVDPETQTFLKIPPLRTITFGLQASF